MIFCNVIRHLDPERMTKGGRRRESEGACSDTDAAREDRAGKRYRIDELPLALSSSDKESSKAKRTSVRRSKVLQSYISGELDKKKAKRRTKAC